MQVSPNSQSGEAVTGNKSAIQIRSSTRRQGNEPVQLPPYVYVPSTSTNEESLPVLSRGTTRTERSHQHETTTRSTTINHEDPVSQHMLSRRQLSHMYPVQQLYHLPLSEERMMRPFQPQYIVLSPSIASHSSFLRPYDFPIQAMSYPWLQQPPPPPTVRFQTPESYTAAISQVNVNCHENEKLDKIDDVNDGGDTKEGKAEENKNNKDEASLQAPTILLGEKPKRPLSAYNYFFKEEREKMIGLETGELGNSNKGKRPPKKKRHGIKFEEMARNIAKKWNNIDASALEKFEAMARSDKERYKIAMEEYNQRKSFVLAVAHRKLASTVSKEKMKRYLENQDQTRVDNEKKTGR